MIGISGEGMYRYDVARRVLTRIHVQQQLKGDRYVCFIDTNNGIWLSDQENDFHYYPEKAAFNNLSSIFERLEDPFVKIFCSTMRAICGCAPRTILPVMI